VIRCSGKPKPGRRFEGFPDVPGRVLPVVKRVVACCVFLARLEIGGSQHDAVVKIRGVGDRTFKQNPAADRP
jgi:hypothetical protein